MDKFVTHPAWLQRTAAHVRQQPVTRTKGCLSLAEEKDLVLYGEGAADEIERLHARGLELAKALAVCIEAIAPADRGGISMHEWNERLKAAQVQACAALSGNYDTKAE